MPRSSSQAEFEALLASAAEGMALNARKHAAESREQRQGQVDLLRRQIQARWRDGLSALDTVCFAMTQHGQLMLRRLDEVDESNPEDEYQVVRIVLALLQCHGTIVLQEIRTLIENGFWSGGAARWRALHETAVSAKLIVKGGAPIAERYMDHAEVVQVRRLKNYYDEHGVGPVPGPELERRFAESAAIEQKHALPDATYPFRDSYGWALPLMRLSKKGNRVPPTMDKLEKLARLDHRRLLVASSHGMVHADAAGVHASVQLDEGGWLLGPTYRFTDTVVRPTLDTIIHLVGATHAGFEPEINDFAETILALGGGLMQVCREGVQEFERAAQR